ncbi:ATP-binding protein [Paenibacillus mesotrionivorans]|uniref:ATP-binding protein n=1 Tax=Paenibacillus mesotrionivorans TaxID=3160968 RepID=A0ACC7NWH4_9BACL
MGARVFKLQPDIVAEQLKVPAWLWNSHEWGAFSRASSQVQRPILSQALKGIREGLSISDPLERKLIRVFKGRYLQLGTVIGQGPLGYSGFPARQNCGQMLENILNESEHYFQEVSMLGVSSIWEMGLNALKEKCKEIIGVYKKKEYFSDFSEPVLLQIHSLISNFLESVQAEATVLVSGVDADSPVPFSIGDFPNYLEAVAAEAGGGTATNIQYLIMRIRTMLSDRRFNQVVTPPTDPTFEEWLETYVGKDQAQNGPVAVIDLSLVPSDLLHVIAAVISRIVFEAVQRYKKLNAGKELPTVLVLEEAHTFIKRDIADDQSSAASIECRKIFEKIAREGRKFGLGLVLSSQRPSELSPTVLSQCNTFLLHRIVNDRDQELVGKLVPDNLGGLLCELPSLPAGEAILMGWASPIPVLVKMKELPAENRPESSDPQYWDVWVGCEERKLDWTGLVEDWRQ